MDVLEIPCVGWFVVSVMMHVGYRFVVLAPNRAGSTHRCGRSERTGPTLHRHAEGSSHRPAAVSFAPTSDSYFWSLKLCEVSILMLGVLTGCDMARIVQIVIPTPAVSVTPSNVKPYAQSSRAHGHFSGLRQLLPNDSLSRRRKSSVIGLGSTALHTSHSIHAATPTSVRPKSAVNAAFNTPPRYTRRSHGVGIGGGP